MDRAAQKSDKRLRTFRHIASGVMILLLGITLYEIWQLRQPETRRAPFTVTRSSENHTQPKVILPLTGYPQGLTL
ncbi:MAG: hypothetical protein EAZ89_19235 [Bacteroidetes bacterium]|jgi:hypothetical protein|nr:MAG: hypothetical protein EAZ89_19235 [Bacteroidota bacterium]